MNKDMYAGLLKTLGNDLGIEDVHPNEDGECTLAFDDCFVSFSFIEDAGMISMYSGVCEVPGDCPREVLEMLLDEQVFFKGTRGATLSLSKSRHMVLAHLNLFIGVLDSERFSAAVQNLLQTALEIRVRVEEILDREQTPPAQDVDMMNTMNIRI